MEALDRGGPEIIKANSLMQSIHHRMPVILDSEGAAAWLHQRVQTP
jgi:putative SOS response-associated peptidase YedK